MTVNKNYLFNGTILLLFIVYTFSIFKNLQYPLLWNDEAETAMLTRRTIEFGYPKVHDGKNTLYMIRLPEEYKDIAINESTDAYVGIPWAMIYFGLIGESLANLTDDIYLKTGLLRLPFALIGLLGLILLGFSVSQFIDERYKYHFWIAYLLLLMTNIHLTLHLREVRYYSLVIFTGGLFFNLFLKYRLFKQVLNTKYLLLSTLLLWLSFHVFSPLYFALATFLGVFEVIKFLSHKSLKLITKGILPSVVSFILLIPVFIFFRSFEHSAATAEVNNFKTVYQIVQHSFFIIHYFIFYENIYITIVLILVMLSLIISKKLKLKQNNSSEIIIYFTLFFVIYLCFVSAIPIRVSTRYFIILLPFLALITSLIFIYLYELTNKNKLFIIVLSLVFIGYQLKQRTYLIGRYNELTKQYKGVLDYTIPYIIKNYKNSENLVIAANYEECAYMYYLGSKVTYGYVGNSIEEDSLVEPDVVAYRKYKPGESSIDKKDLNNYKTFNKKYFIISDYPFNNNPELNNYEPHLFESKISNNDKRVFLLLK